jgi:hypothetical protein
MRFANTPSSKHAANIQNPANVRVEAEKEDDSGGA